MRAWSRLETRGALGHSCHGTVSRHIGQPEPELLAQEAEIHQALG